MGERGVGAGGSGAEVDPLVSILIPAWGCRAYIGEAIRSALSQSYPRFEVLVLEDGGDDGTYEEALRYQHPRLRVLRNASNLGQYANKNKALSLSSGPLVKFLDGDDVLESNALSALVDEWRCAGPGIGVVFGQFSIVDSTGAFLARPSDWGIEGRVRGVEVLNRVLQARLPGSRFGNVSAHLFDRHSLLLIGGFPNDNGGPGDVETFLKLLATTDVAFTDCRVARYRVHPASMTGRTFGVRECRDYVTMVTRMESFFRVCNSVPPIVRQPNFYRQWKVWAGGHNILAAWQRGLRGKPDLYREIKMLYAELGLADEFRSFVRWRSLGYILRTIRSKLRRHLFLPESPPLFG